MSIAQRLRPSRMPRGWIVALTLILTGSLFCGTASADFTAGFVSWDVTFPGNSGAFDIINDTGPNASAFPDTTFPITTALTLSGLSLVVHFSNGTTVTEPTTYFTLAADGLSYNGTSIAIGGTNPTPTSATLTGTFSPTTISLNSGGPPQSIQSTFSTTILPSSGRNLADGDFGLINATPGSTTTAPEPSTLLLLLIGVVGIVGFRRMTSLG